MLSVSQAQGMGSRLQATKCQWSSVELDVSSPAMTLAYCDTCTAQHHNCSASKEAAKSQADFGQQEMHGTTAQRTGIISSMPLLVCFAYSQHQALSALSKQPGTIVSLTAWHSAGGCGGAIARHDQPFPPDTHP